ncbi:MAG TPA: hypothetical protein VMG10_19690 [Gemmataceae bacterium]|nr:hypothetical protein [Gemmataceae bacterium]
MSLETRRRLEQILDNPEMRRLTGENVRTIRGVQVLEGIGSPAARDLLTLWSRGDTNAWLTQEAKAALQRLARRSVKP